MFFRTAGQTRGIDLIEQVSSKQNQTFFNGMVWGKKKKKKFSPDRIYLRIWFMVVQMIVMQCLLPGKQLRQSEVSQRQPEIITEQAKRAAAASQRILDGTLDKLTSDLEKTKPHRWVNCPFYLRTLLLVRHGGKMGFWNIIYNFGAQICSRTFFLRDSGASNLQQGDVISQRKGEQSWTSRS